MKFASNMTQLPGALFTSEEEQFLHSFAHFARPNIDIVLSSYKDEFGRPIIAPIMKARAVENHLNEIMGVTKRSDVIDHFAATTPNAVSIFRDYCPFSVLTHSPVWRQKFLSLILPAEEVPTVPESKPTKKKRSRPPVDKKPTVKRPRKKKQAPEQIVAPDQESALKSLENWMAEQVSDEPKSAQVGGEPKSAPVAGEAPTPSELTITDAGKEAEFIIPPHVCPYFECAYPMCVIDWSGH